MGVSSWWKFPFWSMTIIIRLKYLELPFEWNTPALYSYIYIIWENVLASVPEITYCFSENFPVIPVWAGARGSLRVMPFSDVRWEAFRGIPVIGKRARALEVSPAVTAYPAGHGQRVLYKRIQYYYYIVRRTPRRNGPVDVFCSRRKRFEFEIPPSNCSAFSRNAFALGVCSYFSKPKNISPSSSQ